MEQVIVIVAEQQSLIVRRLSTSLSPLSRSVACNSSLQVVVRC